MPRPYLLIVDDDEEDRMIFSEALKIADAQAQWSEADSAENALRFLDDGKNNPPDLIFLDLNMPGMDGWQCLLEIRRRERFNNVPVIIFSTSEESRYHNQPVAEIAVYFMTKQSKMVNLIAGIRSALNHNWEEISLLNKKAYF